MVLRLATSSYFVGSWTSRSVGFSPLRIRILSVSVAYLHPSRIAIDWGGEKCFSIIIFMSTIYRLLTDASSHTPRTLAPKPSTAAPFKQEKIG